MDILRTSGVRKAGIVKAPPFVGYLKGDAIGSGGVLNVYFFGLVVLVAVDDSVIDSLGQTD
jgi:hypothetical protein